MRRSFSSALLFLVVFAAAAAIAVAQDQFRNEEVKFNKGQDAIAGTLLLPEGAGPFPAVVLLHGSEAGSRKMPHYHRAAARLVKEGIAVLITDKRGVGDSTGTYIGTPDMKAPAEDAVAKVGVLAGRKHINPKQIGVLGWSQGGWVGPLAATMSPKIAFVITVAGPAVSIQEQVIYQRGQELLDKGFSQNEVDEIAAFRRKLWAYYGTGKGYEELLPVAEAEKTKPWFAKIGADGSNTLYKRDALSDGRFQFFRNLQYDPEPALAKLKVPILAVFGDKDRLIPVKESTERLLFILTGSGHSDFTIRVFRNAGHGIQVIEADAPKLIPGGGHSAPAQPPTPAPGYWDLVTDWIKKRIAARPEVRK